MICACCGLEIQGKAHGPYSTASGHEDYVCDKCWNDPSLSFPDKVSNALVPSLEIDPQSLDSSNLSRMLTSPSSSSENLHVNVVRLSQGNITAYVGKMKAADILMLYDLRRWNELTMNGYQRHLYEERKREIARYLKQCPIPVIPAIFVSVREDSKFLPSNGGNIGTLEIPKKRGSIMLIDGQHRMAGFQWYLEELVKKIRQTQSETNSAQITQEVAEIVKILRYDIPVLFVDSKSAVDVLRKGRIPESFERKFLPEDVERLIFYILNKTQKGISPSLKDTLQFHIYMRGIKGIPSIERERWRVDAADIGHRLNRNGSPLDGKINLSGARGTGKPLQLNSWITSLEPLFTLQAFKQVDLEEKCAFVQKYWSILREMFEEAFEDDRSHLLLKSIGIYSLNRLAANIYEWCSGKGTPVTKNQIAGFLEPLCDFNWYSKEPNASLLRGLGGRAGVNEAYKIILEKLANGGITEAAETLEQTKAKDQLRHISGIMHS